MSAHTTDLIDQVLFITPGSRLDALRRHREVARDNIQKAYLALFEPKDVTQVSLLERLAVASFVAGLHGQIVLADHYAHKLSQAEGGPELSALITAQIEAGATKGPYGAFPAGPLSAENKAGLHYRVGPDSQKLLDAKLSAALEHAHLLVFRPRDASRDALQHLLDAGWSTAGVVTLSQLVAYLSFQVRIVDGLAALASANEQPIAANSDNTFTAALAAGTNS